MKTFPVLQPVEGCPHVIPWGLIQPHERQAQTNHSQTLEELARRGGLDVRELYYVLNDKPYGFGVEAVTEGVALFFVKQAALDYLEAKSSDNESKSK